MCSRKFTGMGIGRVLILGVAAVSMVGIVLMGCDTEGPVWREGGGAGQPTPGSQGEPTIVMVNPASPVTVLKGQAVTISWIDNDSDDNAQVTVFYQRSDTLARVTLSQTDEDPDGQGDVYIWDTSSVSLPVDSQTGEQESLVVQVGATIDDGTNAPVTRVASSAVTIAPSLAGVGLQVLAPSIDLYTVLGQSVEVVWLANSLAGGATIRVFYDQDGVAGSGDEVLLTTTSEQGGDVNGRFVWNTTSVQLAIDPTTTLPLDLLVKVGVTLAQGGKPPVTRYAPGVVYLSDPSNVVNVALTKPDSPKVISAGQPVQIAWVDYDQVYNASITVFYDLDAVPNSGNEFVLVQTFEDPDGAGDRYTWDTTGMADGTYRIGITLADGANPPVTRYAQGVVAIGKGETQDGLSVVVLEPNQDVYLPAGQAVPVGWLDEDPDHDATVIVFYDQDGLADTGDEIVLYTVKEDPDGVSDVYLWQTTAPAAAGGVSVPPFGTYYVGVTLDNGVGAKTTDYAPGVVVVRDPALGRPVDVVVREPVITQYVEQGDPVLISWVDFASNPGASVRVFYDFDRTASTGDEVILAVLPAALDGPDDRFVWDTTLVKAGTKRYWIGVTVSDPLGNSYTEYARGFITVIQTRPDDAARDLRELGDRFGGTLWRGWNAGDQAGYAMDGGQDVDGDGIDDMVIVARYGNPFYQRVGAGSFGEAYLIFGQPYRFFNRDVKLNSVAAPLTSTERVAGTIYAGPRPRALMLAEPVGVLGASASRITMNGSSGLTSVAMIPNQETATEDEAGGAEIVFGVPFIEGIFDEGDFDPVDDDDLNNEEVVFICLPIDVDPLYGQTEAMFTFPVYGVTPNYMDFPAGTYLFEYDYGYYIPKPVPPEDPNDPPTGEFEFGAYNTFHVELWLPFVVTNPGMPVQNPEDVYEWDDDLTLPAYGYAVSYNPWSYSDSGTDYDNMELYTGVVFVASSIGGASTIDRDLNGDGELDVAYLMDGQVYDMEEIGSEDRTIAIEAWGSQFSHGARFRPEWSYGAQDEIDNRFGWYPPSVMMNGDSYFQAGWGYGANTPFAGSGIENHLLKGPPNLIPSDWGQSLSWADMNGDGLADLLVGAPRMPSRRTWGGSPLLAAAASGFPPTGPADFPAPPNPATANMFGQGPPKADLDGYLVNSEETGGIAVISARLNQPDVDLGDLGSVLVDWYQPENDPADDLPFPSWPNAFSQAEPTWYPCGEPEALDWERRFFVYPLADYLFGDVRDYGGPRKTVDLDGSGTFDRMIDGGQLSRVCGLGDWNSDGFDDLTCGAPRADRIYNEQPDNPRPSVKAKTTAFVRTEDVGVAYIVFGRRPFGTYDIGNIDTNVGTIAGIGGEGHLPGIELRGTHKGELVGFAQGQAGFVMTSRTNPNFRRVVDFDGDGVVDWLVGVPGWGAEDRDNAGMVAVVFGHDRDHSIDGAFTLADLNVDNNGPVAADDNCDKECRKDGVVDDWDLRAAIFHGEALMDQVGTYVAGVGDVNADGYADILISAPYGDLKDSSGKIVREDCGKAYLIYGQPDFAPGDYDLGLVGTDDLPGKVYYGPVSRKGFVKRDTFGDGFFEPIPFTVSPAGDVDDDGFDDYLIGNPRVCQVGGFEESGEVYLIYGEPYDLPVKELPAEDPNDPNSVN